MNYIMNLIDQLPDPQKLLLDIFAVFVGIGSGAAAVFQILQTPLAGLASLAALVYTVMRIIQLHREMKKEK